MIFRLAGLPTGITIVNVTANIDAIDDKFAFNDDFTLNIRRLAAAGITGRQTCGISQPPFYRRITRDFCLR